MFILTTAGALYMPTKDQYGSIQPRDRSQWREWLRAHHDSSEGVWLVYTKRSTGKQVLTYEQAVEEALSFGWIDGRVKSMDDLKYRQMFTPRKKGSTWARSNKERVKRLTEQGLMSPAGLAKVEEAKRDGSWNHLEAIDQLAEPPELSAALDSDLRAREGFDSFTESQRKQFLWWLHSAKRLGTRTARIEEIMRLSMERKELEDLTTVGKRSRRKK
jgi:uncharacterized protein YdeI (YjbR/CyaY-like superfamily)